MAHTISNNRKLHLLYNNYACRCNLRHENYVSEIKYQKYQQILKEIAVLECENAKIF